MRTSYMRLIAGAALALFSLSAHAQSVRSDSGAQAIAIVDGGGGGGGGNSTTTIRNAPTVYAPGFSGANPCTQAASGGGSVIGFGLSVGASWDGTECRDQEWFRFYHMAGAPEVAWAHICANVPRMHAAMRMAGRQCPNDNTPRPTLVMSTREAPVVSGAVASPLPAQRPEWCATASREERARHRAVCG